MYCICVKHINFNRFDGAHTENFCSAALLLAMDSDKEVHKVVVEMLLKPLEHASKRPFRDETASVNEALVHV